MVHEPILNTRLAQGNIYEIFESHIHHKHFVRLSKHLFRNLRTIDWDALRAFHLVDDVE